VCAVHYAGYAAAADRLKELCDAHSIALIEDVAHAPSASLKGRKLGTWGLAGAFSFFSNKVFSCGEGGLLCTDSDEVAEFARSRRSHAMTSGTWDRHNKRTDTYDVLALGFNYRIDEPRSALLLSRLERLEREIELRRELTVRYRERLKAIDGLIVPFEDDEIAESSCYVMPVMLEEPSRQSALRMALREEHRIQTSLFYPAVHEFTAYQARYPGVSLPNTELAARSEVTLPLYSHMNEDDQDRVVAALAEEL
jgi:dTDP-4-amino-4,6-dideoxygalactose transaminase